MRQRCKSGTGGREVLVITRNQKPVARLMAAETPSRRPRKPGSAKVLLTIVKDDDEHLADFEASME